MRNCTLTRVAVGAGPGETRFTPATGRNNGSGHFSTDGPLAVKITSLDEFSRNHRRPNLIKMDIEGAEVMALQGAAQTLSASRPVIFLATNGNAGPECIDLLRSHGYRIEMLAHDEIVAMP